MAHCAARRWGSSGSISQLVFPPAAPGIVAEDSASRGDPPTGHWLAEASPLRRHSSQAERLLRPGDASPPHRQRLPQVCRVDTCWLSWSKCAPDRYTQAFQRLPLRRSNAASLSQAAKWLC